MNSKRNIYSWQLKLNACFILVALTWLTISAQFMVVNSIASVDHTHQQSSLPFTAEEDTSIPVNTEEKTTSNGSILEEYLHEHSWMSFFFGASRVYERSLDASLYVAYHGELLVPPPNFCI